jgi:hypothetical protein
MPATIGYCQWNPPAGVVPGASNPGPCYMMNDKDTCSNTAECSWEL